VLEQRRGQGVETAAVLAEQRHHLLMSRPDDPADLVLTSLPGAGETSLSPGNEASRGSSATGPRFRSFPSGRHLPARPVSCRCRLGAGADLAEDDLLGARPPSATRIFASMLGLEIVEAIVVRRGKIVTPSATPAG